MAHHCRGPSSNQVSDGRTRRKAIDYFRYRYVGAAAEEREGNLGSHVRVLSADGFDTQNHALITDAESAFSEELFDFTLLFVAERTDEFRHEFSGSLTLPCSQKNVFLSKKFVKLLKIKGKNKIKNCLFNKNCVIIKKRHMNNNKFTNLVLYILAHEDYKEGGIKKLNKLLYFIDFYFYRDNERLISGMDYAKAEMGPVVDQYKQIFIELEEAGFIKTVDSKGSVIYKPLKDADLKEFTPEEIDHIGRVLNRYGRLSSNDLELISHQQQPWLLTEKLGEKIDPDLALLISDDSEETEICVENKELKEELVRLANSA